MIIYRDCMILLGRKGQGTRDKGLVMDWGSGIRKKGTSITKNLFIFKSIQR
jgi:hypothetical protein